MQRGRPRCFDPDRGIDVAARLFREKGYDAVGVAEIVRAIGINPPSFYAAYGSKKALLGRVLERYGAREGHFITALACPGRPLPETAEALFLSAVDAYTSDPDAKGCLVFEGTRNCADPAVCALAREAQDRLRDCLVDWISDEVPRPWAAEFADFVLIVLAGLSAEARNGMPREILRRSARIAAGGFRAELARLREMAPRPMALP
jgi:TetR/AcrR family transcriptional regulator, repressor for divergent bdcA